ncbi:hypothetical protein D3C73_797380 [compost metagenome]
MRQDGISFVMPCRVALLGNFVHVRISGFVILSQPEVVVLHFHMQSHPSCAVMPPLGGYGVEKTASLTRILTCSMSTCRHQIY